MAYILIDGYNLIGIGHSNLEKARNDLLRSLQKYSQIKDHQITVVFDGWKTGLKDQTRSRSANVTVIYTRLGETADVVIRKMLTPEARPWIVVSTDREIYDYASRTDFASVTSEEFEKKLYRAVPGKTKNKTQDAAASGIPSTMEELLDQDEEEFMKFLEDETEAPPAPHKGNPRKLSKKQKKKIQALKKL